MAGEKDDIATLGFTGTGLFEQKYLDLPEDCTRNWLTHVFPETKDEHGVIAPLPLSKLLTPETKQTSWYRDKSGH